MDARRGYSIRSTWWVIGMVAVGLFIAACSDDPLLSPEGVEDTDTGGSYGKLEYPSSDGSDVSSPRDSTDVPRSSHTNPARF